MNAAPNHKQLTWLFWTGTVLWFLLAILFYFPRAINYDSAYYLYHVLLHQQVFVPNNRYPAILPQLPVILAAKAGVQVNTALWIYSLSAAGVAWLPAFYFYMQKKFHWTYIAIISMFLFQAKGFFYPISDFRSGIPWLVGWSWCLLEGIKPGSYLRLITLSLLLAGSVWSHPLAIVPILMLLGYWSYQHRQHLSFVSGILTLHGILIVLRFMLSNTSYDGAKLQLPEWTSWVSQSPKALLFFWNSNLIPEALLFLILMFLPGNPAKKILCCLGTTAYLLLVQLTQHFTGYEQYTDHLLSGLALVMAIYAGYRVKSLQTLTFLWLTLGWLFLRSIQIVKNASEPLARTEIYQRWISEAEQHGHQKVWVYCPDLPYPNWDAFYQTILMAAAENKNVAITWTKTPVSPNILHQNGSRWNDGGGSWNINQSHSSPLPAADSSWYQYAHCKGNKHQLSFVPALNNTR